MIGIIESKRYPSVESVVPEYIGINTSIGGVASTLYNEATLAAKLGINASDITLFRTVGPDVHCRINVEYLIPANCFEGDTSITYYRDLDGKLIGTAGNAIFYQATNLVEVDWPGCTYTRRGTFNTCYALKIVNIPKVTDFGGTVGNDNIFTSTSNIEKIYVHPDLATCNAGAPDGDLQSLPVSTQIIYVTNIEKPGRIDDLEVETSYATALKLSFTVPASSSGIDFYYVFVDGVFNSRHSDADNVFVIGLDSSTEYLKITVVAADTFFNKSDHSNETTGTTGANANVRVTSYYNLEEVAGTTVNDSVGTNDGVSYGATFQVAGKVGKGYSFTINDYLEFPGLASKFNGTDFSVGCWFKTTQTTAHRLLQNRGNGGDGTKKGFRIAYFSGAGWETSIDDNNGQFMKFNNVPHVEKDGNWHFAILTWNSSLGRGRFYIDGVLKSEKINTNMMGANLNGEEFVAGKSSGNNQFFTGTLDEIPFAEVEWNQAEISDLWNNGNGITL